MPKVNVFTLTRPERPVETREFTEAGQTFTLTFREPDAADLALAAERAQRLVEDYLTGSDIRGPAPYPHDDVKPSRILFNNVAVAVECQAPENPGEAYDAEEFLLMTARLPQTWLQVQGWLQDLTRRHLDPKAPPPAPPTG